MRCDVVGRNTSGDMSISAEYSRSPKINKLIPIKSSLESRNVRSICIEIIGNDSVPRWLLFKFSEHNME
eukprot:10797170-Karenia_brevis.AAC.1